MATDLNGQPIRPVNGLLAVAVADFKALRHQEAGVIVMKLLETLIAEYRVENDTADVGTLTRNQGKIDVLLRLKGMLERG